MRAIRRKLAARQGASIAIAMIFFLFCILVCSVILTAATANAGRFRDMRQEEQAYLTSSSAARLLRDSLQGYTFEAKSSTLSRPEGDQLLERSYSEGEESLAQWLRLSAQTAYDHGLGSTQEVEIRVEGMETAYAQIRMTENFDVVATVYLKDGEMRKNPVELLLPATVERSSRSQVPEEIQNEAEAGSVRIREEVTAVSWQAGTLQRGGSA